VVHGLCFSLHCWIVQGSYLSMDQTLNDFVIFAGGCYVDGIMDGEFVIDDKNDIVDLAFSKPLFSEENGYFSGKIHDCGRLKLQHYYIYKTRFSDERA
jgi:hypothetical protein